MTSSFLGSFVGHGSLSVAGAVSGPVFVVATGGHLKSDAAGSQLYYTILMGATLELSGGTAADVNFVQHDYDYVNFVYLEQPCTLELDSPATFAGSLVGISVGDMIHLPGISASAAFVSDFTTLAITQTNGPQLNYRYHGPFGSSVLVDSDDNGGSIVYITAPPATGPTTIQQEIAGLYAALYNRTADAIGMQYWVDVVAHQADALGVTLESSASTAVSESDAALLGRLFVSTQSGYFDQLYGNLSDADFVSAVYLNIGGRDAESQAAINFWVDSIHRGTASGLSEREARGAMVGEFVSDIIAVDLASWAPMLSPNEMETAVLRQSVVSNKLAVSFAFVNASARPEGSFREGAFLNAHAVGDAAFMAQINAVDDMVITPLGAAAEIRAINNALIEHDLTNINLVGVLLHGPIP
jgi:hypothetical protein